MCLAVSDVVGVGRRTGSRDDCEGICGVWQSV